MPSNPAAKRIFDVVFSLAFLILLGPLLLAISLIVRADSPGPAIFRQKRIGLFGKTFTIFKFRTMHMDADPLAESPRDYADLRITRAGRFLRRFGLDEIPQLYNILRGDMSFVGPRPQLANELEEFHPEFSALLTKRLTVRPGLTCLWVIAECKEKTKPVPEMFREDCRYVDNLSFGTDLRILLRTFKLIFMER